MDKETTSRTGSSRALAPSLLAALVLRQIPRGGDGPNCCWCGSACDRPESLKTEARDSATVDHVNGTYGRGNNDPSNLVIAHRGCNSARAAALRSADPIAAWTAYLKTRGATIASAERRLAKIIALPLHDRQSKRVQRVALEWLDLGERIDRLRDRKTGLKGLLDVAGYEDAAGVRTPGRTKTDKRFYAAKALGWIEGRNGSAKVTVEGNNRIARRLAHLEAATTAEFF